MLQSERVRFGPERIAMAPVLLMATGALPLGLSSPWLRWVLLVPVLCAVWVLRARVVVGRDGLEVCNGLATHRYRWEAVEGFDVPRRGAVRLLTGGQRVALTALPRSRVRDLVAAASSASGVSPG
jgi:hypothetical protein